MFLNRPRLLLLSLALMLVCGTVFAAAQPTLSPRLQSALGDEAFAWRNADGDLTVWVYFTDKGLAGDDLVRALDQAEAQLDERTAWRRGKVTARGARLVDARDLPIHADYRDAVEALGAKARRDSRWLNATSFRMTDAQVRQVAELPFVREVDLVARFQRTPVPVTEPAAAPDAEKSSRWTIDYGSNLAAMEQAGVPAVHEMGINGQGVIIGMLDGGFHTGHEALSGIPVIASYDFVNDDGEVDNETGDPSDSKDHGTMTMSTAMGYAPGSLVAPAFGASAVLAKTEDVSQEVPIEEDQWVAGLEFVESHGADIVSSSLGYLDWYDWSDMDGATAVTTIAADLAVGRGVVVINSAGNERGASWNHIIAPADGDSVIAVGAVTSSGSYSYFSSPGPSYDGRIKPDVAALGSSNHVADPDNDTGYTSASGTSFSCPLTSGVAALVLSRAPSLTPMQVREALRETASMADSPNNDYGWGIINAYAAVNYFGPSIAHEPLTDTEMVGRPQPVTAIITDRVGLLGAELHYRVDGGPWSSVAMATTLNPDEYAGQIPGQAAGAQVDYYLHASGGSSVDTSFPAQAPDAYFTFRVGPDVTAPFLTHTALGDQAHIVWPPMVQCTAADNLGIDRVELVFSQNGGPDMGPYELQDGGEGYFSLAFPVDASAVLIGDQFTYTVTAIDAAGTPNQTSSGPHGFAVIDALGVVLVLDDSAAAVVSTDLKYGPDKKLIGTEIGGRSSATTMADWLNEAGYVADVMAAAGATLEDFQAYQLVVLSAGDNSGPVAAEGLRTALQDWVGSGGKLLVEGGEVGYDAVSSPGYPTFASQVLHTDDWNGDSSGDLITAAGQENHPLLNNPHLIDPSVGIAYDSYGDEDAMTPTADAYLVMGTADHAGDAGILVYDDNPAPQAAQIVYFAFNVEAAAGDFGRQLTLNAARFLLAAESPATSYLSGTARVAGESDHSGILVDAGSGLSVTTGSDGAWSLGPIYAASYTLTFSKAGWGTQVLPVELGEGESLTGLDVTLTPTTETHYSLEPGLAIPDDDETGITSTITVPASEAGVLAGVTVDLDIAHTYQGDLIVQLTGPDTYAVVLHDRSGGGTDDIVGNYPETLEVAGPGELDHFIGENNAGDWVLAITDNASIDTGTLNAWGLNFLIPSLVSGAAEDGMPVVTRLLPNAPNPFNPRTRISFDLAVGGKVQLGIFDVRGHLVRHLVDEDLGAGSHFVRWDGKDDGGRSVASGVYLYRLQHPTGVQERKMVLVR